MQTDNLRIAQVHPLITPAVLEEDLPLPESTANFVKSSRTKIRDILSGRDTRFLVIVGPCSIHDPQAAVEYAQKLKELNDIVAETIFCVMRVYFEKPRTVVGWKGLINDPDLDGSYRINKGLRLARQVLLDVNEIGLPAATEFLDTTFGQYYTDLVSWGAIGARTVESQIHRELASGLSMPVGLKNRTDGDVQVAVDAIRAAAHRHLFPSLTKEGAPAILETLGNPDCHLVLRGGHKPNHDADSVASTQALLSQAGLPETVVIDCSHANACRNGRKDANNQSDVARSVVEQRLQKNSGIRGIMLESHLLGGRQDISDTLTYGMSITDPCLDFDQTRSLLLELAGSLD